MITWLIVRVIDSMGDQPFKTLWLLYAPLAFTLKVSETLPKRCGHVVTIIITTDRHYFPTQRSAICFSNSGKPFSL
jgi:hypothetical protein